MFSVGEKVVCIHVFSIREDSHRLGERNPIKGEMYTIRTINVIESGEMIGTFLRFEELINPILCYANGPSECQFCSTRFRKLDYDFAEDLLEELVKENKTIKQLKQ